MGRPNLTHSCHSVTLDSYASAILSGVGGFFRLVGGAATAFLYASNIFGVGFFWRGGKGEVIAPENWRSNLLEV